MNKALDFPASGFVCSGREEEKSIALVALLRVHAWQQKENVRVNPWAIPAMWQIFCDRSQAT